MSNKSIGSKLQGLEERLRTENSHRKPRIGDVAGGHLRSRQRLELPFIPPNTALQDSLKTEAKLREIYKMSGVLKVNDVHYRSTVSDLQHLGELGNGTCGHVVKMLHTPSNVVVAVKQMRRSGNSEENKRILMDLEVVLRSHDCPYIVRCLGYFITEADVWICMELMASCFDKILKRLCGPVPEEIVGKVTVATVSALSYLKEVHGVIHRDVKPSNILIDERGVVKLCDFGISGRLVDSKAKTRSAGCAAYMAPERINPPDPQKPDYDIRADVWSLGITLVELATGTFPYCDCQNDFEVLSKVIEEEPPVLPDSQIFSDDFKSFVRQCLTKDYRNRPKYAALLDHHFVTRAAASGASVKSWLTSALPPSSPRILATPPVFRRRFQVNGDTNKSDHQAPSSTSQLSGSNNSSHISENEDISLFNPSHISNNKLSNIPSIQCDVPNQNTSCDEKSPCTVSSPTGESPAVSGNIATRITGIENYENTFLRKLIIQQPDTINNTSLKTISKDNLIISELTESGRSTNDKSVGEKTVNTSECLSPTSNSDVINRSNFLGQSTNPTFTSKESHLNSPQTYRTRSHSNTSAQGSSATEKWPPPKFTVGSPNTKNYFNNLEVKSQPFSGGGGGPSSFDSYTNYDHSQDVAQSGFRSIGSPEVRRRQYYSPSRNKFVYNYEYGNPRMDSHPNVVVAANYNQVRDDGYKNLPENGFPPPCFRPNGPTNYFVSTSVCTMSKYPGSPSVRCRSNVSNVGNFHQNIGGSCSQPASLEAYGDTRQNPVGQQRLNEKNFPPQLWSPQLGCRWGARDREDREREVRRMSETNHHQQGNTSPIVLQRFYHQQGQRRSRRDWDTSSRQTSLSREASVGRSPEPPRRAHRDPSVPRDHLPQHHLLREWRERELTPSRPLLADKNEKMASSLENDKQFEPAIRPQLCEKNQVDRSFSPVGKKDSEHFCNDSNLQFDMKLQKSTYHHHMRETDPRQESNGDCRGADKEEKIVNDSPNISSVHDRLHLERNNSKEKTNVLRERDKKDNTIDAENKEDITQLSPHMLRKLGKSNGKEKDEQGGSRSSSPNRTLLTGGSTKVSRFTSHPQRITACEYDDVSKCSQDISRNFTTDVRNGGRAPQVPPRKATASWSLPASPLPARPV